MIKVALTGNIACGKTQVENILTSQCYKVIDTDRINHYILMTDVSAINEIKAAFENDDILDENSNISRDKLGKIVFSDNLKKQKLEEILHKRIFEKMQEFYKQNQFEKVVFASVPLLFETKMENLFDKIILISADEDIRLERLIERNNYTRQYAQIRINSQMPETEKIKKADYVIYNNSDFMNLRKQVLRVLTQLANL
jgi:dephospho-CoA kinase